MVLFVDTAKSKLGGIVDTVKLKLSGVIDTAGGAIDIAESIYFNRYRTKLIRH
jgi:hypothetical protein